MQIHVVRPGETLYGIARQYGVSVTLLGRLNQVPAGGALAVGQTLVVYEPERVHVVRPGETLEGIARREGVSVLSLYQNNYFLGGRSRILPDEELIVALKGEKSGTLGVNGYAYTFIRQEQLRTVLPYITYLTPFTYGVTSQGGLVVPDDGPLLAAAPQYGAQLWMHLSTLTDSGSFDSRLGGALLENETAQKALIDAVAANMAEKGSLEGKMTITIDVSFTEETVQNRDPNIEGDMRIVHTPKFQHKVGSVLQIKNEQKGDMNCDGMEMIWDNEKGEYVLRPITGRDQMSIFDMEVQNAQESATDAEVVEGEVLEGRKIPALPMNEPEDDESDGSPEDGPQDEEDMSDEFGDDYGYDDPEEY